MSEQEYKEEIVQRLAAIETQLELMQKNMEALTEKLDKTNQTAIIASQASKSAHHRISTMYCIAGAIGAVVSFVVDFFRR